MMGLSRFSIQFEKRKYADMDALVKLGVNQVYHMVRHIPNMTDDEIKLFMLNFSNIVYLEKEHRVQGDYEYFQKTFNQVPVWLKDIQARVHKETITATCLKMMRER